MKRLVASLLCISLIFTQYKQAEAAVPVVVAGVAAGAVLLLAAGAVQYYSNPGAASAVATAAGNIYTNATAYTQAVSALGQGYMMAQAAALKVAASDLLNAALNAADGVADGLKSKFMEAKPPPEWPSSGSVVATSSSGTKYTIVSEVGSWPRMNSWSSDTVIFTNPYLTVYKNCGGGYCDVKKYTVDGPVDAQPTWPNPPPVPITAADVPNALTGSPDGGAVSASDAQEINNLIASGALSASGVSVSGTTTGDAVTGDDKDKTLLPPYVPPATVPGTDVPITPSTAPPTTTTGLGTQTTAVIEGKVLDATQTVTSAEQALAADPTNTALQADLAAAQAALAAAQAALNQAKAAENEVYINPTFPNRKTLNFESWRQLVNVLPTKFPFNLVTSLGSYLEPFLAPAVPPSFELHIYQDKKLDIDLAVFDTPVAIFRWGLALLLTFGFVQFLIRWWKGTA
jgi:hypothetical protein